MYEELKMFLNTMTNFSGTDFIFLNIDTWGVIFFLYIYTIHFQNFLHILRNLYIIEQFRPNKLVYK